MKVHIPDVWLVKSYTPSKHNVLTSYLDKYALRTTCSARLLRVLFQKVLHMESQTLALGPWAPGRDLPCFFSHLLVCLESWGTLLTHRTCMDLPAHPFKSVLTPCKNHSCLLFGCRGTYTSKVTCLWEDRSTQGRGPHWPSSGLGHLCWEFRDPGYLKCGPEECMGFRWAHPLASMGRAWLEERWRRDPKAGVPSWGNLRKGLVFSFPWLW